MIVQPATDASRETLFKRWVEQHTGLVFKVARTFAPSDADRDDLVQEILLQLWRSLPRFEGKAKESTWIYRVALNTALAWHRSENKRHAAQSPSTAIEELPEPDDPAGREREELVANLYGAIRRLPKVDGALVLLYLDDLNYREMACVLGISETNVGVKLNRARKTLAELMKEVPMNDELKKAWQSQTAPQRLTRDAGLVLNEVRRNERQFAVTILSRDVREAGVALLMVPVWIYSGIKTESPWSWYLVVPTLLWVAGFMIVDRVRHRRQQPGPGDTLRSSIESSLAQVDHQIWLLRNIFWWYLLPPFAAMTAFPAHRAWQSRDDGLEALAKFAGPAFVFALVGWFLYWLNQRAVRKDLEPRRKELQTLLRSLNESGEGFSQ